MTLTRLELIKKHIDSLPVLPGSVTRLMELTRDPESSAKDIMEAILPDQSLCLTILKIANSALFGRPKKVDSIKTAITVLGFNEVQNIAITKALINSFKNINRQHQPIIDKFWEHAFVSGVAARIIAQDLHITPDVASMGGLIHDIGKLIMLETFDDDYAVEQWMTTFSSEELLLEEKKTFSFTHDQVGGQLLREWSFPDNLIAAAAYHHHPGEAGEEKTLACIIQLSDLLSFYCCNEGLVGDGHILAALDKSLPDMRPQWKNVGLEAGDEAIEGWFNWLLLNREQAGNLKNSFS
ncbi:MAG: HDOD domain-containing protein [Desulfocapsaceae bacterium]|jgi:putative nucleotidyltransferase with HDIG domain|nr:HDOD domain-containing protein [Desulfocapsaceae bacterium]